MMSFSYRAKLSKKLNKCTYRPIWSEFCADPYSVNGIYELLARIGMSWISARSKHPQADINAQEAFKKTS